MLPLASDYAILFTLNKIKGPSYMHKNFEQNKKIEPYSFNFEQIIIKYNVNFFLCPL